MKKLNKFIRSCEAQQANHELIYENNENFSKVLLNRYKPNQDIIYNYNKKEILELRGEA